MTIAGAYSIEPEGIDAAERPDLLDTVLPAPGALSTSAAPAALRVSDLDYFPAYAGLPRKAQRKADEFLRKFEQDSTGAALHFEPIKRAIDTQLRSARIVDDYRVILRAPEQGDV